jgi:hypothetical protein
MLLCSLQGRFAGVAAQTVFPNFDPDPAALQYARLPAPYSWQDLSGMALWASGVRNQSEYFFRIADAVSRLQADPDLPEDTKQRGEYVLAFMHDNYLTRYVESQTLLDTLLEKGAFNCVSSSVFYTILAAAVDLDTGAVNTHDHAFVTLKVDGTLVDVETTNKYGFDPGSKIEFRDEFGKLTGYAYTDPQNYKDRSPISQIELVSLIINNRISILLNQNRMRDTIPLMANTAAFLSTRTEKNASPFVPDQQENLKAGLFKYGNDLERAGKYDDAVQFIMLLQSRYAGDPEFEEFSAIIVHNAVVTLLQQNRIPDAKKTLNENKRLITQKRFSAINAQIQVQELAKLVSAMKTSADAELVLSRLNAPETVSFLDEKEVTGLRNNVLNSEAIFLSRENGLAAAIQFAEKSLSKYGKNPTLEQNLEIFRHNRVVELHNSFSKLWNSGKESGARAFLEDALKEFPNSGILLDDLKQSRY